MGSAREAYRVLTWRDGAIEMIDQRLLPGAIRYVTYTDYRDVAEAIRSMVVRGAPAIGVAAGYGMALAALGSAATEPAALRQAIAAAAEVLRASRPTAVNLFWAIDRVTESRRAN